MTESQLHTRRKIKNPTPIGTSSDLSSQPAAAVRRCISAYAGLTLGEPCAADPLAGLIEAVNDLAATGTAAEAGCLRAMRARLAKRSMISGMDTVCDQLEHAARKLDRIDWLPRALYEHVAKPFRLLFVRHAESTGNVEKRLQGSRIAGALTPRGQAQAARTAVHLASASGLRGDAVLLASSTVGRAIESAQPVAARLGCALHTDAGFAELDFGGWSGQSFADLETVPAYRTWMQDHWFIAPPGGESLFEVRARTCQALSAAIARAIKVHADLVVVTHFFPMMAVFGTLGAPDTIRPDNSSVSCFEFNAGRWRVPLLNSTAHLGEVGAAPVKYV